jgi:hypothetical protein
LVRNEACNTDEGVCEAKPLTCPDIDAAVCGRNGMNYRSACHAHLAGVYVLQDRRCEIPPGFCGCSSTGWCYDCDPGDFCQSANYCFRDTYPEFTQSCMTPPETCPDEDAPVCSCGSVVYRNACEAARARESVAWMTPYLDENGELVCPPWTYPGL